MSIYVPLTEISENLMQRILSSRGQEVPIVNNRNTLSKYSFSKELCMLYDVYTAINLSGEIKRKCHLLYF